MRVDPGPAADWTQDDGCARLLLHALEPKANVEIGSLELIYRHPFPQQVSYVCVSV
jgi:hypothetical protein